MERIGLVSGWHHLGSEGNGMGAWTKVSAGNTLICSSGYLPDDQGEARPPGKRILTWERLFLPAGVLSPDVAFMGLSSAWD